jgi:hypothetical protein
MNLHKLSRKKIMAVFIELYKRCDQRYTYSVIAVTKHMGIDYNQIEQWAPTDERLDHILQLSRQRCSINAEVDCMHAIIPPKEGLKYLFECDDDWIALYPTQEKQQTLFTDIKRKEVNSEARKI